MQTPRRRIHGQFIITALLPGMPFRCPSPGDGPMRKNRLRGPVGFTAPPSLARLGRFMFFVASYGLRCGGGGRTIKISNEPVIGSGMATDEDDRGGRREWRPRERERYKQTARLLKKSGRRAAATRHGKPATRGGGCEPSAPQAAVVRACEGGCSIPPARGPTAAGTAFHSSGVGSKKKVRRAGVTLSAVNHVWLARPEAAQIRRH